MQSDQEHQQQQQQQQQQQHVTDQQNHQRDHEPAETTSVDAADNSCHSRLTSTAGDDVTESRDYDVIADRQCAAQLGVEVCHRVTSLFTHSFPLCATAVFTYAQHSDMRCGGGDREGV